MVTEKLKQKLQNFTEKHSYYMKEGENGLGDYMEVDATYENIEKLFALRQIPIRNVYRDVRGDWGDDGGFIIVLSEMDGKFYLYIMWVCYNGRVKSFILTEHDKNASINDKDNWDDFVVFYTEQEVQDYLEQFVKDLDYCMEMVEYYDSIPYDRDKFNFFGEAGDPDEFYQLSVHHNKGWTYQYAAFLSNCFCAYQDYDGRDAEGIKSLTAVDKSTYFRLKAQQEQLEYQLYLAKVNFLKYRINNPEFFEVYSNEIQVIIRQFYEDYKIDSNNIYVDVSKYEIEALLKGSAEKLYLKSGFGNAFKPSHVLKAYKKNDDDVLDTSYEGDEIKIENKNGTYSQKTAYYKEELTVQIALCMLFKSIEKLKKY